MCARVRVKLRADERMCVCVAACMLACGLFYARARAAKARAVVCKLCGLCPQRAALLGLFSLSTLCLTALSLLTTPASERVCVTTLSPHRPLHGRQARLTRLHSSTVSLQCVLPPLSASNRFFFSFLIASPLQRVAMSASSAIVVSKFVMSTEACAGSSCPRGVRAVFSQLRKDGGNDFIYMLL
eukprot:6176337-Pleurochrysis_carterae.AAC.1